MGGAGLPGEVADAVAEVAAGVLERLARLQHAALQHADDPVGADVVSPRRPHEQTQLYRLPGPLRMLEVYCESKLELVCTSEPQPAPLDLNIRNLRW